MSDAVSKFNKSVEGLLQAAGEDELRSILAADPTALRSYQHNNIGIAQAIPPDDATSLMAISQLKTILPAVHPDSRLASNNNINNNRTM